MTRPLYHANHIAVLAKIIIWRFYALIFYFEIVICLSKGINLVYFHQINPRAKALTCSCCSFMFVLVLFIYLGKLQTKRSCWPVFLPFYPFNIECCQCGVGWSSHCQNMMQSLSLAAEAWFGTFIIIIIIMWFLTVIFKQRHWNIRSLQPAVNWYMH